MNRFFTFLYFIICCSSFIVSNAQDLDKSFTVKYTEADFTIDGILDESAWESGESVGPFQEYFPNDDIPAKYQTDIRMLVDDETLYVGIKVYTPGNDYVIPSLERDWRSGGSDNISVLFDTFNDGNNVFLFGINPLGVRREVFISGGGQSIGGFTTSWDVKWTGESKIYDGYYTAEMAIPLTSFKFAEGETKWRFQSYRYDMQANERSVWYNVPQNQSVINLAFMGDMYFEKPLGRSRTPLAIIPFINGITEKDFTADESSSNFTFGGDAKISLGNSMNLDITLNPDFSNVEVDDIFTNLTRFEVNLPERRQFFIDNNDLFGNFGNTNLANPFFSRRIGIATDRFGNRVENDIIGGVRLSGKVNKDLRLGFLNLQTAKSEEQEVASNNNMMFALQQKVFSRSNIGVFMINRQTFDSDNFIDSNDKYNRVVGLDYNLATNDNVWFGKFYGHKSFQAEERDGHSAGVLLGRNTKNWNVSSDLSFIEDDFRSDLGFILRKDILRSTTTVSRLFWPKEGKVNNHRIDFNPTVIWRPKLDYQKSDHEFRLGYRVRMKDFTEFGLNITNNYIFLNEPFDPTGTEGGEQLEANRGYNFNAVDFNYRSNNADVFSFRSDAGFGEFFNGYRYSVGGEAVLRLQPVLRLSLSVNYDRIEMPNPLPSADLWLVSPRIGFTFTKSIFWSTVFQYANQRDNLGINSRLQWRFAPLSDLFIVYNDNYFVNSFQPKFRSINLKLTYWLNI
ncbi:carbohydrate binding family 9 domain-containing protein [Psychroflexus sp. CAK8W]|uniref:Carbohydrate binding family 9 domain-containing protein n=1 Tax=Psychroflexus longus TaxID=2873596 RepID=A0ABS7XH74_9FLAO|nr:DUF5916 domain-containing protein [Psychroflexus longus]MBZ9778305.1 carbohydrate binding family 9 domain-containing protein [Psychroflexus longus]